MRINRQQSRLSFRQPSRYSGCLPLIVIAGLFFAVGLLSRERLYQWLLSYSNLDLLEITAQDAQTAFEFGDLDSAIELSQARYGQASDDMDALTQLVRALIYRSYVDYNLEHERQLALDYTTAAIAHDPHNDVALALHAYAQQAQGISEEAAKDALQVIRKDSEQIVARLALSLSYGSRGIFAAALREAERAVEIAEATEPAWRTDAYRVLAIAYSDLGRYVDAGSAAETAIQHNRRLIPLHFERALYATQIGDADTATASYFTIIALDDANVKVRLRLCEVSSRLGERETAIDYCTQVTQRAPGWSDGWYYLGREYFLKGDWLNTREALGRCSSLQVAQGIAAEDRRFECWYLQGQAAEVLGNCTVLIALYEEFQQMASQADLPETWTYPPDGPAICSTPQALPAG